MCLGRAAEGRGAVEGRFGPGSGVLLAEGQTALGVPQSRLGTAGCEVSGGEQILGSLLVEQSADGFPVNSRLAPTRGC